MARFEFDFDFEYWQALAENDPASFFAERERVLQSFLGAAPDRLSDDLQALQSLIDHSRAQAGSPTRATSVLMDMLGEHVAALAAHMTQLREQTGVICTALGQPGGK